MATDRLVIELRLAWWFTPYLYLLIGFCVLMDGEPDWEKLSRVVQKAIRVKVVN